MKKENKGNEEPPDITLNPYIFTALLFLFGVWCFFDGWISSDPNMQKHQLFNRILSMILIPWSIYDFYKVKKSLKKNEKK